jgi:hypothetical protein
MMDILFLGIGWTDLAITRRRGFFTPKRDLIQINSGPIRAGTIGVLLACSFENLLD